MTWQETEAGKAEITLLNESVRDIIALILFEYGYETAAEKCEQ